MTYMYKGPVMKFGQVIDSWESYTNANTFKKAYYNLVARYKKEHGYSTTYSRIELNPKNLKLVS